MYRIPGLRSFLERFTSVPRPLAWRPPSEPKRFQRGAIRPPRESTPPDSFVPLSIPSPPSPVSPSEVKWIKEHLKFTQVKTISRDSHLFYAKVQGHHVAFVYTRIESALDVIRIPLNEKHVAKRFLVLHISLQESSRRVTHLYQIILRKEDLVALDMIDQSNNLLYRTIVIDSEVREKLQERILSLTLPIDSSRLEALYSA